MARRLLVSGAPTIVGLSENRVIYNRNNPLVHAPHTAAAAVGEWDHPYPRELAVFPAGPAQVRDKYWPPVRRIDGAYGDRHLVCACPPPDTVST